VPYAAPGKTPSGVEVRGHLRRSTRHIRQALAEACFGAGITRALVDLDVEIRHRRIGHVREHGRERVQRVSVASVAIL
jgi:hypothetical protein